MNLDQLLRDSAPDSDEMHRETRRMRTRVVTQFQATEAHRPHHRGRWAAGVLAAAAAATAYVVVSPGGPAVSPAYAIDQQADGDVVITIHRLEDSAGLQAALREHGIDAEVSFGPLFVVVPATPATPPAGDIPTEVEVNPDPDCGTEPDPATLSQEGADWVLRIPAESPLQDRPVYLATGPAGSLELAYLSSDDPPALCTLTS